MRLVGSKIVIMVDEKCMWGQKINYSKVWGSWRNYGVKENKKEIKIRHV